MTIHRIVSATREANPSVWGKYFKGLRIARFHVANSSCSTFLLCNLQIKDTFWIMQEYSQLSKAMILMLICRKL